MRRIFLTALVVPILFGVLHAQRPERTANWVEDLKAFVRLMQDQKDLAKLYPSLEKDVAALAQDVDKLRDGEIHLRLGSAR